MTANLFREYASNENNVDWKNHIEREIPLYQRKNDIRWIVNTFSDKFF